MAQLSASRYKRLSKGPTYGQSDGIYWDTTNLQLVLVIGDSVVAQIDATGITADLEVSNNVRGDLLRRGASALERFAAKTSGQIVLGDGTDVISAAVSGDATISAAGALTVTDVTVGSDAAGDMLYKSSATALTRLAKGSTGQIITSDGSIPAWSTMSGDATIASGGALALAVTMVKYVKVAVSSSQLLAINATPKTLVAAPGQGFTTVVHRALLVLNYVSAAYANNGILGIYETDAAGALLTGTLTLASFLALTADAQKELHPTAASATTGLTRLDNKAVVLTAATGETITGNSPVDVHLWYSTVPNGL